MCESLADKDDLCINQHQRQRSCCLFPQILEGSENTQVIKFTRSFSHKIFLEKWQFSGQIDTKYKYSSQLLSPGRSGPFGGERKEFGRGCSFPEQDPLCDNLPGAFVPREVFARLPQYIRPHSWSCSPLVLQDSQVMLNLEEIHLGDSLTR